MNRVSERIKYKAVKAKTCTVDKSTGPLLVNQGKVKYMKNHENKDIKPAPEYDPFAQGTFAYRLLNGIAFKASAGFDVLDEQNMDDKDMDQKNNEKERTRDE